MIYSIEICATTRLRMEQWRPIVQIVNSFLEAVRYGFFGITAVVVQRDINDISHSDLVSVLRQTFIVEHLNQSCFLILAGMLKGPRDIDIEISSLNISIGDNNLPLDRLSLGSLPLPRQRHIYLIRPNGFNMEDPFVMFISFSVFLTTPQRTLLHRGLEIWEELLIGGLPANGFQLGESAVGATRSYFSEPQVCHYAIDGISADPICLDLLLNFFEANQAILNIQSIEIQ